MAAPAVAAAGAAVALYFSYRRSLACGSAVDTAELQEAATRVHFKDTYQAPNTWLEAMYFFAEALRYILTNDAKH